MDVNYYKLVEICNPLFCFLKNRKDWQDILKSYQKEHLYISESASILARNVIYEVPALKRLITKLEQAQSESFKKEATCKKQSQDYRDKFNTNCTQLGLQFDIQKNPEAKPPSIGAVGKQLTNQMSQELPAIFDKIALKSKDVREAVLYYRRFLENNISLTKEERDGFLGLLLFVIGKY